MNTPFMRREDGGPLVKICGMRRPADIAAVRAAGADLIGLEFEPSKRQLTPEEAHDLLRAVPDRPPAVGVFVDADEVTITRIAREIGLDLVQLSGHEAPDMAARLPVPYIRTIHLKPEQSSLDALHIINSHPTAAAFLLDSWSPLGGGSGTVADWSHAATLIAATDRPILLAGGLRPENVAAGLLATGAYGADVSSGVEREGWKDAALIQAFVDAVRSHSQMQRDGQIAVTTSVAAQ